MEIVQLTLGALGTNCYLVKREEGVLVIDPAAEPERIASKLASLGWKPDAVVLTRILTTCWRQTICRETQSRWAKRMCRC